MPGAKRTREDDDEERPKGTLAALAFLRRKEKKLPVLPSSFSWLETNPFILGPVRKQRGPSCLAESLVASFQALYALKHKTWIELSVQEIIDRCPGHFTEGTLKWISENGMCLASDYPEIVEPHQPKARQPDWKILKVSFGSIKLSDDEEIMRRLLVQPVVAGLRVCSELQKLKVDPNYVYSVPKKLYLREKKAGHSVLLVEWKSNYWNFKNSWGIHWGDKGYGKAKRRSFVDMTLEFDPIIDVVYPIID